MSTSQTFLFTDIEGSTLKWQRHGPAMADALARHDALLQECVSRCRGRMIKHTGDGIVAVFDNGRALECALEAQSALTRQDWSGIEDLRVRICVYAGEACEREGDFFGPALNGASRMLSAAWGGQVLVNEAAHGSEALPDGASLTDSGVHVLRDLLEPQQIYVLAHPSIPAGFPALRTVSSRPQNLPVQPTPFLGRARELEEIASLLESPGCRLLTILAPGGTGKSRLAIQAAARVILRFRHGAFFVPLEDVASALMIPARIASTMSFRFSGAAEEEGQLARYLADREILIVADNFEHLSGDSPVLARLLAACPGLRFLVTSRHRLNLREEIVYELGGMALPSADGSNLEESDASSLFLACARRSRPDFSPGAADRRSVAGICEIVAGSPLGIELASSWVRMVGPGDIETELRKGFDLLDSAPLDMPGRHRGLEAVFLYSWSLLEQSEKQSLAGLSVLVGEYDASAAREVAGSSLPMLRRLTEKSLLRCTSQGRFAMHPLVRAYALGKLGESPDGLAGALEKQARHFAAKLQLGTDRLLTPEKADALDGIEADLSNHLQAWDHAILKWQPAELLVFAQGLGSMFHVRSRIGMALRLFEQKLVILRERFGRSEYAGDRAELMALMMERIGVFQSMLSRLDESKASLLEALGLAEKAPSRTIQLRILGTLGIIAGKSGDSSAARDCWTRILEPAEADGNYRLLAGTLTNLASLDYAEGDRARALEYYTRALDYIRRAGDPFLEGKILGSMGYILGLTGEKERAEECLSRSLELSRRIGDRRGECFNLMALSSLFMDTDRERAGELARESLSVAKATEYREGIGLAYLALGEVHIRAGEFEEASQAAEQARTLLEDRWDPGSKGRLEKIDRAIAEHRNPPGEVGG